MARVCGSVVCRHLGNGRKRGLFELTGYQDELSKIQQIIKKINGKKIAPRLPSPNFFFSKNFTK